MEWFPVLEIGWSNGWLTIALLGITDGFLFLVFPRSAVSRLFDRSGWSVKQLRCTVLGKVCVLGCLGLLVFNPLKIGSRVFILGAGISLLGWVGLIRALLDFKNTPLNEPVVRGMYRISRHPQIVMSSIVLLGGCIAVGSWTAVLLLAGARIFNHFGILAEEEECLDQYGEEYREYINQVPRYFLFI